MSETRWKTDPKFYYRMDSIPGLPRLSSMVLTKIPVLLFFLHVFLINPVPADAHGTEYQILETARAITVECRFAGGDPMQYAEVLLFSPDEDVVEYQNGRTDQLGRFAFFPDIPGTWRMKVQDGMGHAIAAVIQVDPHASSDRLAAAVGTSLQKGLFKESPRIFKAAFAVSLLFNFFLGISFFRKKAAAGFQPTRKNKGQR